MLKVQLTESDGDEDDDKYIMWIQFEPCKAK